MICRQCGKDTDGDADICPDCENGLKKEAVDECEDTTVGRIGILFLAFPILGFVMYFIWRGTKPEKAKTAGYLGLFGAGLGVLVGVVTSVIDSQSRVQNIDYRQSSPLRQAARVQPFIDPCEIHDLLQDEDLPWIAYMLIWGRLKEGTEARRVVTDLFFDSEAPGDTGDATLRDLSDGSWRKAFADYALKYVEIRIATVETMQEIYESSEARDYLYSEIVHILTTGTFSLEQLLSYARNLEGRYDQYEVVCGGLPDEAEEVDLDPIIDVYVDEDNSLILRTAPSYEDKHVAVTPMHLDELVRELELLKNDCGSYDVVCSESDPNDNSSTIRVDFAVNAIGINDEHKLFVFLLGDAYMCIMDQ